MSPSKPVYVPESVQAVLELYGALLNDRFEFKTVSEHLEAQSYRLYEAWIGKEPGTVWEISNYHPELLSCSIEELFQYDFTGTDARLTIAREYGYRDWDDLKRRGAVSYDHHFEEAVDLLINGEKKELSILISKHADLVHQRSNYGHQAGLLHYCASNGVELWRQQVPLNLPEMIRLLLSNSAERQMKMQVYGGQFNPLALLRSSAHPLNAGVAEEAISCFATS